MCSKGKGSCVGEDVLNQSWDVYGAEHSLNNRKYFHHVHLD